MNRVDLLSTLNGMTQRERMEHLIALRRRAHEPEVAALLDSLAQGDTYERWSVLQTCSSSRDMARLRAALTDDSAALRHIAMSLLLRFGDDSTLVAVLAEQTPQQRIAIYGTRPLSGGRYRTHIPRRSRSASATHRPSSADRSDRLYRLERRTARTTRTVPRRPRTLGGGNSAVHLPTRYLAQAVRCARPES